MKATSALPNSSAISFGSCIDRKSVLAHNQKMVLQRREEFEERDGFSEAAPPERQMGL
jgi:hypothetical protein